MTTINGPDFADPGGRSALRAATPADKRLGYQCDACADRAEGGYGYDE
jgi:hypothetical protein